MIPLSSQELADMRVTQDGAMQDTCLIAEPGTSSTNAYKLPTNTWDWAHATQSECGFDASPSAEVLNQVPTSEVTLRLPVTRTISNRARVRVTKRFGETQASPVTYEVVGMPRLGPSGLLVWLKKVTDGS